MKVSVLVTVAIVLALAGHVYAEQRPEPAPAPAPAPAPPAAPVRSPTPPPPPPAPPRQEPAQLVNIRIDVTIAEEGGTAVSSRKTVSLTLADRQNGSVRSVERSDSGLSNLNVDAFPVVQRDGRVQARITIDYSIQSPTKNASMRVEPLLTSGKPLMVSQSASPTSDRRLSVEVVATVLK